MERRKRDVEGCGGTRGQNRQEMQGRGGGGEAGRGRVKGESERRAKGKGTMCATAVQGQAIVTGLMAFESQPRVQL